MCDLCKSAHEDQLHALWSCPELDVIWSDVSAWSFRMTSSFDSFKELVQWIFQNQKQQKLFAVMVWSIWSQQNQIRLHQPSCNSHLLAQTSKDRLEEFQAIQLSLKPRTVFSESNFSGAGVVIRNHQGFVIASLLQNFSQAFAPLEVEVLAAARDLEFAAELGIKHTVLEGDSLMLIQALKNGYVDLSPCGLLLDDVRYRSNFFTPLHYSHVKREGNKVDLASVS
uniref:RNase H type-1 domain-containing protein n=1 Tax=Quercus lobata TaxID=97700 RepID=A0A7N2MFF8_QUELO